MKYTSIYYNITIISYIIYSASILIQFVYDNLSFRSPFLVTYICNGLFVIYLPLWQIFCYFGVIKNPPKLSRGRNIHSLLTDEDGPCNQSFIESNQCKNVIIDQTDLDTSTSSSSSPIEISNTSSSHYEYTHEDVFRIALCISPIWFFTNLLYNYSLFMTSISSSTIIRFISTF